MTSPNSMRASRALSLLVILALGLLPACGTTPPSRFYVLTPTASASSSGAAPDLIVRLDGVRLPKTILRAQIVTRVSDHELDFEDYHRWAEPLDDNVTRVVAANLEALMSGAQVYGIDDRLTPPVDVAVLIDIQDVQSTLGGTCALSARWQLATADGDWRASREGAFTVETADDGHAALVQAFSLALAQLCEAVADSIAQQAAAATAAPAPASGG